MIFKNIDELKKKKIIKRGAIVSAIALVLLLIFMRCCHKDKDNDIDPYPTNPPIETTSPDVTTSPDFPFETEDPDITTPSPSPTDPVQTTTPSPSPTDPAQTTTPSPSPTDPTTPTPTDSLKLAEMAGKIVVVSTSSSSINIRVDSNAKESGITGYMYSKDNGVTWTALITSNTYTFTGLDKDKTYQIKVKAVNSKKTEKVLDSTLIKTTSIGMPSYQSSVTEWTSGNVKVTITFPSNKESNWVYQYKKDNGEWVTVNGTTVVEFSANGTVVARIVDKGNEKNNVQSDYKVTNIDKTAAIINSVTVGKVQSSSITVSADAKDAESGIKGYMYSKDNGATWTALTANTAYTFTGLTKNTDYKILVKVVNGSGLETISSLQTVKTTSIGLPTFKADVTSTTNGKVKVTITFPINKESNWEYQYKKDNGEWVTVNGTTVVEFSANGTVTARIVDKGNEKNNVQSDYKVNNIDKGYNPNPTDPSKPTDPEKPTEPTPPPSNEVEEDDVPEINPPAPSQPTPPPSNEVEEDDVPEINPPAPSQPAPSQPTPPPSNEVEEDDVPEINPPAPSQPAPSQPAPSQPTPPPSNEVEEDDVPEINPNGQSFQDSSLLDQYRDLRDIVESIAEPAEVETSKEMTLN